MNPNTITLDLEPAQTQALDQIAVTLDCDRAELLKYAIDIYLQTHEWQTQHILKGIQQADAGNFATEAEVNQAFAKWRR
jgi:RHH-type transcriptional regulator, rel operon repressor / antitoxin RelB